MLWDFLHVLEMPAGWGNYFSLLDSNHKNFIYFFLMFCGDILSSPVKSVLEQSGSEIFASKGF